ncbi:hypothetical protein CVT24_005355 [Panaeolus cyanescens]|uniref:Uncharacterized protein n=1 Tax=Panaeolus cyanescens TaxID=181874 RepID=A0A409Y9C6_9AGAR|nr:hypothetical protein CVT24_005355 [Panaeolus cyanescens]
MTITIAPSQPHTISVPTIKDVISGLSSTHLQAQDASVLSTTKGVQRVLLERQLGETEVSYFLPSRESGVNDMYLHLGCNVPLHLVEHRRVSVVWAIMRVRHPLLASHVKMVDYNDIRFRSVQLQFIPFRAGCSFHILVTQSPYHPRRPWNLHNNHWNIGLKRRMVHMVHSGLLLRMLMRSLTALIDAYLNGPRTLSNERLSYLIVSGEHVKKDCPVKDAVEDCNFLICATHFLGDGMALHTFANDFFSILGSTLTVHQLTDLLSNEWEERMSPNAILAPSLPSALEDKLLRKNAGRFAQAVAIVDFKLAQQKDIGGHTFPRKSGNPRKTIVPTVSYDAGTTKKILAVCKQHGVSISAALFAICNVAWARTQDKNRELPMMMYSALNIRPNLIKEKQLSDSYWFIAIGYFNVVLPSFLPRSADIVQTFWKRAQSSKIQSVKAAKNPMLVSRCYEMAKERGARARVWAKEDDDKLAGIAPTKTTPSLPSVNFRPKGPSAALIGLSLLGNLDGMYKHALFPEIQLHTLTTGSRQRSGGMLLFGYTFVGKLWVSLGYDVNGFEAETVNTFWDHVNGAIAEFLIL